MEYLDIVDDNGKPTGQIEERTVVHEKGLQFRSSHVWVVRNKNDNLQVLLQKRALHKASYPGCYDISSAGHVPAGMSYTDNAVKELEEELGIAVNTDELIECGLHRMFVETEFNGKPFLDRQVAGVFVLWKDIEIEDIRVQKEEVDSVKWFGLEECMELVRTNQIVHCIDIRELELVEKCIENSRC